MATRTPLDDLEFTFGQRPAAVPALLRPGWRVPLILLLVLSCRRARARWEQLVVLNWAVRTPDGLDSLRRRMTSGEGSVEVRFEPALERAAALARGFGWLEVDEHGWLALTAMGRQIVDECLELDLYQRERAALASLPALLSQGTAQAVLRKIV
jgi:hypothetical protein